MDASRPQSAPTHRAPVGPRPLTAPASRNAIENSETPRVRFSEASSVLISDNLSEVSNPEFWALSAADPTNDANRSLKLLLSAPSEGVAASQFPEHEAFIASQNTSVSDKRVSFKGLHLEKAAVEDYRGQQRKMALRCVTSLDGWEETKNSLISSIQNIISPDIALTDKARKTVLNSILSNFFAVLHIPSFKVEHFDLEQELHSKVPSFLMQLQKDVRQRQGSENTVDLNERETKQGILGTYGKQFMIEAFISGISLAREDEESTWVMKKAALNEEFRKLQAMRKELESSHTVLINQRSKLNELGLQLKSKDQRIDDLERQIRRRDDSHADQVASLLKEIHALKTNVSKATSIAQATTHGIQIALSASAKQQVHAQSPSTGALVIESARSHTFDVEQKKISKAEQKQLLAGHEKRIYALEEALFSAQATNLSESQSHRSSLAAIINWVSSALKFEEELFAVVEKIFRSETSSSSAQALTISGKQMTQPQTNEKLTSLLALTQEISKVSIEISKISTQKLSKFYKLLRFASDLLSFIDLGDLALPADLESQKQELFQKEALSTSDDIIMFPEGQKVQKPMSSEDAELKRILGKERTGFRNSLLELLHEFHKRSSDSQKNLKNKQEQGHDTKVSRVSHDNIVEKESHRRDLHESPKTEHPKGKFKAVVLMQPNSLSSPVSSPKFQPSTQSETLIVQPGASLDDQSSLVVLTKQRDEYMERLSTLSSEMVQLQISMKEIQRQRAEMFAKTAEDSDELAITILELKREKATIAATFKAESDALTRVVCELTRERDILRDELFQKNSNSLPEKGYIQAADSIIELAKFDKIVEHVAFPQIPQDHSKELIVVQPGLTKTRTSETVSTPLAEKQTTDAGCQTIEDCANWQSSKFTQTEIKSIIEARQECASETTSILKLEQPVFKMHEDIQPPKNSKIQASEINRADSIQITSVGATQMIFDATYRNLQTNIAKRISSVFDEFGEGAHNDTSAPAPAPAYVPKLDLSNAFLQSVGESHAQHFQQNGSFLPRFHQIAIKSKTDQKVGFSSASHPRMTKNEESLMSAIAPKVLSTSSMKPNIPRPTVAVLQIPCAFDVPASHFNQAPYSSRPSTSSHVGLCVGPDIRPDTARSSNRVFCPKPHRPTSTRSTDGNQSRRSAKISRESLLLPIASRVLPSPTNQRNMHQRDVQHCTPQVSKVPDTHFDCLHVDESPGIGIHSTILNEYLDGINVGKAS